MHFYQRQKCRANSAQTFDTDFINWHIKQPCCSRLGVSDQVKMGVLWPKPTSDQNFRRRDKLYISLQSCISDAMMNDPRFVSCMDETSGPEDPAFMTVFAKCYSFAGRPRFGKRGSYKNPYSQRSFENWLEKSQFWRSWSRHVEEGGAWITSVCCRISLKCCVFMY